MKRCDIPFVGLISSCPMTGLTSRCPITGMI